MGYEVRTEVFEGPFNLLLQLITKDEVEIYDVSLSAIVDRFLAELEAMEGLDLEVATEFVLIAATLVELKCRRLLPVPEELALDEDLALYEARDYLLARLVECKTFAGAGQALAERESLAQRSVPRLAGPDERFDGIAPDLLQGVTPDALRDALAPLLVAKPAPRVEVDHVLVDELTVAEIVEELARSLRTSAPLSFRQLTADLCDPMAIVVHFLALLELYKDGLIDLAQGQTFGELLIAWTAPADLGRDEVTRSAEEGATLRSPTSRLGSMDYHG